MQLLNWITPASRNVLIITKAALKVIDDWRRGRLNW